MDCDFYLARYRTDLVDQFERKLIALDNVEPVRSKAEVKRCSSSDLFFIKDSREEVGAPKGRMNMATVTMKAADQVHIRTYHAPFAWSSIGS